MSRSSHTATKQFTSYLTKITKNEPVL